jgi:hypothetical protein
MRGIDEANKGLRTRAEDALVVLLMRFALEEIFDLDKMSLGLYEYRL